MRACVRVFHDERLYTTYRRSKILSNSVQEQKMSAIFLSAQSVTGIDVTDTNWSIWYERCLVSLGLGVVPVQRSP